MIDGLLGNSEWSDEELLGDRAPDEHDKSRAVLEAKAMRATVWTVLGFGLSQLLRMSNSLILTRLLLPEYFGLMSLVFSVMTGLTLMSDVGLLPSVIGSPRGDEDMFLDTAWTIQLIRGCFLWLLSVLLARPLAAFYHNDRLTSLIPIMALTAVCSGLNSTNLLTAARHMRVGRVYLVDLFSQIIGIAVTVVWAYHVPNIWALVGGTLTGAGCKTLISHSSFVLPGHRNRIAWEKESVSSLINFGRWILLGTAFYFFASQADRLILGKLTSFAMLGIYGVAFTIADIPRQIILQFATKVGFPLVAKILTLPASEFSMLVRRYRLLCLVAGAVLLTVTVYCGPLVIDSLYDARYHEATWMVPILALGLWHTLLYSTAGTVLFSLGKPRYNAVGTACYCLTMFAGLPVAYRFGGMLSAVMIVAAGDLPFYFVISYGISKQRLGLLRQDAIATLMFVGMLGIGFTVRQLWK